MAGDDGRGKGTRGRRRVLAKVGEGVCVGSAVDVSGLSKFLQGAHNCRKTGDRVRGDSFYLGISINAPSM